MRFTLLLLLSLTLFGCSFGGFQPPPPHDHWRLHNILRFYFLAQILKELINILTEEKKTCRIVEWIM